MRLKYFALLSISILVLLAGCNDEPELTPNKEQKSEETSVQKKDEATAKLSKTPPVIDQLDQYPFPVPEGWLEEKFEVREYDEGMDWEAVFTFDGDEEEQARQYKAIIEELGYETQEVMGTVFKIGRAEFAGVTYHGTFTFGTADAFSEITEGQAYVEVSFTEID